LVKREFTLSEIFKRATLLKDFLAVFLMSFYLPFWWQTRVCRARWRYSITCTSGQDTAQFWLTYLAKVVVYRRFRETYCSTQQDVSEEKHGDRGGRTYQYAAYAIRNVDNHQRSLAAKPLH